MIRIWWFAFVMLLTVISACAPMATETLYKSKSLKSVDGFDFLVIATPVIIDFEENKESLIRRTFFPLLSAHFSRFGVECIPFEKNAESDVANRLEEFDEKVPHYARYLLLGQITKKKPERQYSDVMVEYRLFDLETKDLLIYTQFDSMLGIVKFDVRDTRNTISMIPIATDGGVIVFLQNEEKHHDDIKFIGEALLKGFKEIEVRLGLTEIPYHQK